jgi:PEP-CTERM motif
MTSRSLGRAVAYCVAAALGVAIAGNNHVKADLITTSPGLPPLGGTYMTAAQVHATYGTGPNTVQISEVQHTGFNIISVDTTGPNEIESFNSVLYGVVTILGGSSVNIPFELTGIVDVTVFGRTSDSELGTFATQMTSMDLTGTVGGHSVEVMLDPSQSSTGSTTITDISGGNMTLFRIDSFFDIFTEISLDHGPFMAQTDGPTVVTLTSPEPSTMIMFIGAGLAAPFYAWRRRKPKQVI